jgi:flagellar protein FliO/FliZ
MLLGLNSLLTAVAALAVVLVLVWAAARALRFSGLAPHRTDGRILTVRDTVALDSRRRLHVVRCGARDVVLLTGGGQDVVVGWMPDPKAAVSGHGSDAGAVE